MSHAIQLYIKTTDFRHRKGNKVTQSISSIRPLAVLKFAFFTDCVTNHLCFQLNNISICFLPFN